ncbi:winged helix-turn-helix transcriptional regulator [Candidatus Woesearchaeota archaeon]|nr:winged helix-turn-helix transcriptional regulator [Candidatus Woesearchaeota archaeon]
MVSKKDFKIISHLRQNARRSLVEVSKKTGVPVSTIYDRLKVYNRDIVKKNCVLLDFSALGYGIRIFLAIGTDDNEGTHKFLKTHPNVNSMYVINNEYNFFLDCVFKGIADMHDFLQELAQFKITKRNLFTILNDIRNEEFLVEDSYSSSSKT